MKLFQQLSTCFFSIHSTSLLVFFLVLGCFQPLVWARQVESQTRLEISFTSNVSADPADGRLLLMFSTTEKFNEAGIEDGSPVFGIDVTGLKPGEHAAIDSSTFGQPMKSIGEIPAGEYYVKAILNVYTTFHRSDGHTIQLHMDQGEGQSWFRSPGNFFSNPQKIQFDPQSDKVHTIKLDKVIPPIPDPVDTKWINTFKIKSKVVSKFWGCDMHVGAKVLLPRGYHEDVSKRYPLVIQHGHHSLENPGGFEAPVNDNEGNQFYQDWNSDDFPRFILVTIQHATPYYDASYAVNSKNIGPYGDAMNYELLPEIDRRYRTLGTPQSRALVGCSTGGWEAIATQIWYPDLYGKTWVLAPDQIDFHYYELINLYEPEKNAYYVENEWSRIPLPAHRAADGRPRFTNIQENLREEVIGTRYRSGGQWAVWNALFAPVAEDGYPQPLWDPMTGKIDPDTAKWAIENYDLVYYLRNNWQQVGPKLQGKFVFITGRMDNWYIEQAVYRMEEYLKSTTEPKSDAAFIYGIRGEHCWTPWGDKPGPMFREIGNTMWEMNQESELENAPSSQY